MSALISIITITRNRASLIHRCIESIQKQTYRHYEHLIIDGNSEDNTEAVVNAYAVSDSHIKYIKLDKNHPIPQTYLIAYKACKGDYITSLDDDDEYYPNKIEQQLHLMERLSPDFGMVYCWMDYYDDKTKKLLYTHKAELRGNVIDDVVEIPKVSGTPSLFLRKGIFETIGGYRDDIGIISDWELAARICQQWKVDYVPESLIKVYVNHGAQRMSEVGYYQNRLNKTIVFHKHFLNEFSAVFAKYPKKQHFHLEMLFRSYCLLGEWQQGLSCYLKLLEVNFSLRSCALLPYMVLQRIKIIWKSKK